MTQSEHIKLIKENERLSAELEASRQQMMSVLQKLSDEADKISALENEVASLKDQLYWLRKKVFGKMSEKNLPLDPAQLNLFETAQLTDEELSELQKAVTEQEQTITRTVKARKPVRRELDTEKLPVKEINLYPEGTTTEDGRLKDEYIEIGTETTYGISLNDSTVGGWYEAAVEKLKLLYDLLRQKILSSEYIQVDESVIPVLDDEKHKAKKGYEWCVRDGLTGDVMFYYDRGSRAGRVARELLDSYHGFAQTDGYEVYDEFEQREGITMCGCWAHARRKFVDALDENKTLASEGLYYISQLYAVESKADDEDLTPEKRTELRKEKSYPIILTFEKWMQTRFSQVSPQSRMGRAIAYTYALLPRLSRYVNDGRISIDNNRIENAIRPLALGRKNYLFCGNDASAYRAAIVYSLISTCKAAGVEPRVWMENVLRQLPYYERDGRDLTELLPRQWAKNRT